MENQTQTLFYRDYVTLFFYSSLPIRLWQEPSTDKPMELQQNQSDAECSVGGSSHFKTSNAKFLLLTTALSGSQPVTQHGCTKSGFP